MKIKKIKMFALIHIRIYYLSLILFFFLIKTNIKFNKNLKSKISLFDIFLNNE